MGKKSLSFVLSLMFVDFAAEAFKKCGHRDLGQLRPGAFRVCKRRNAFDVNSLTSPNICTKVCDFEAFEAVMVAIPSLTFGRMR